MHHQTQEEKVSKIYKQVCNGTELEKIKAPEEITEIIIKFSKCPVNMSAYEISLAHPEITTGVASFLRHIRKIENWKKTDHQGIPRKLGLGEVIRQISLGVPKVDIIKLGASDALCKRAERFIRLALKNTDIEVIAEKLSISHYTAKRLVKSFDQNYRKLYENKQEKITLEV